MDNEREAELKQALADAASTSATIEAAKEAVRVLIRMMSDDPNRPGLERTPERVVNSLLEMADLETFDFTVFDSEGMSEMVVQSNIPMHSLCEHHMLPFMGTAAIAYIPQGKIVGLSKLARAVKFCAAGLQNQERITTHIADLLEENLKPAGVAVVIRARHLCMELRGVSAPGTMTTTSCMRGAFTDPATRAEFLALAGVTK